MTGFAGFNLKIPFILAVLMFMSNSNFMLSCVEHEKSCITLGPGFVYVDLQKTILTYVSSIGRHYGYRIWIPGTYRFPDTWYL